MVRHALRYDTPPAAPPPAPIAFPDLRGEWRIGREALRLALSAPAFALSPRGRGETVLLFPGWQAPEASMAPLRLLLRRRGYDARHWGLGVNRGNVEAYLERLVPTVIALAEERGAPLALVGWSLGGVIARELARECPASVSCVVTFGTPVLGGPSYSAAARAYGDAECARIAEETRRRAAERPVQAPIAAIFTRLDSIVSWPACIDRDSPAVTHFEVQSTHLSMGIDPTVWQLVLEHLGRHATP